MGSAPTRAAAPHALDTKQYTPCTETPQALLQVARADPRGPSIYKSRVQGAGGTSVMVALDPCTPGVGCRVQGAGCRLQGVECRVQIAVSRVQGVRCRGRYISDGGVGAFQMALPIF